MVSRSGDARSAWADTPLSDLRLPEPPEELSPLVVTLGELRAGTRTGAYALRGLGSFAEEARTEEPPEYVLAGVEEASTGLYCVHYLYSYRRLFLALQVRIGTSEDGLFHGNAALDEAFCASVTLRDRVERMSVSGKLPGDGRLVVVDGAFANGSWCLCGREPAEGGGGIAGALAFLDGLDSISG